MARYGLPGSQRLRKPAQFTRVFDQKCSSGDRCFSVHVCVAEGGAPRLGMVVSRRVSTKAVVRNRIKRLVREWFRLSTNKLENHDIVVVARSAAASADGSELKSSLDRNWQRLIKRCGNSLSTSCISTSGR